MRGVLLVRVLLVFVTSLLCAGSARAVRAMRGVVKTLTLGDGTVVDATLVGDEYVHYYKTADGRCLQMVDGAYEYVDADSLRGVWMERLQTRNSTRSGGVVKSSGTDYTGSKKGLVILVNFADLSMITKLSEWNNYFNEVGYSNYGMQGSVHDYFYEQSYGAFDITFDVVGPVTVSEACSYYGTDEDDVPFMIKEACELVDAQVNFADYDWDGDGEVDQVYVVYAGYNEAQGADESTIWPHEWALSAIPATRNLKLDGVLIDTYACSSELNGNGKSNTGVIDGIGTACHEFSHCLGLPNFYDTGAGTNYGMDVWSVMDYGNYNEGGYVPAAFTAYERFYCGWLELTQLDSPAHISDMPSLTDEPVAYVVYNDATQDECYILQNIQQTGFNSGAYGHGLLITHVDYDASAWNNNTVNNESNHQRMTIFAADNRYGQYGSNASSDPFPGTGGNTSFTDNTTPASILYNANVDGTFLMGKPIENIDETGGLISFDFMAGSMNMGVPVATAATTGNAHDAICDLAGRRLSTPPAHGIYIRDGKKILAQ